MKWLNNIFTKIPVGVKASIVYTVAVFLSRGLAIITVPIFTRLMPPDQMGVVNLFHSWQSMLATIATLALTSGGYAVAMKEFANDRHRYMSSVLTLTSLMAILISVTYYSMPSYWNEITGLTTTLWSVMLIGFGVTPATEFWLAKQRYEYKYKSAGVLLIATSVLGTIVSVIAVLVFNNNGYKNLAEIRLYSSLAVNYCFAFALWIYIMIKGRTFYESRFWKLSLSLSIPLIGNSVASQILSVSDRTMIGSMIGNREVGLYSILYSAASISLIIWGAINSSFIPFLFENVDKPERADEIKKISTQLMLAYGMVAIVMTIMAPEIIKILATSEYYEAIYIMPPIAAGVFFTSVSNMHSNMLIYHKKTQFIMISSIIAAILNVVLNYFCLRIWGYVAAAYTTLIAYMVLAFVQCIVSRKIHRDLTGDKKATVYEDRKICYISLTVIVLCMSCLWLYSNPVIRYSVILFVFILLIWNRSKLISLFKVK